MGGSEDIWVTVLELVGQDIWVPVLKLLAGEDICVAVLEAASEDFGWQS